MAGIGPAGAAGAVGAAGAAGGLPARPPAPPAPPPRLGFCRVLNSDRIGHVHPAIRSKRAFSARLCASARSRDVSITPAVVRPAAAACRNPRRSTWCESLRLSVIVRYLSEGAKRPWSKSRQMIQEAATPPEAHNGPPLTPD